MILMRYSEQGLQQPAELCGLFRGRAALLVGGAPSLKEQSIELLNERGVLTMAMNNAAIHFQPTMWVSGDRPECFEPQVLEDPKIMKFAPIATAELDLKGQKYYERPNMFFYMQRANVPWEEYLEARPEVPWYNNTLLVGIHILYQLGVRRIILAGSDLGFSKDGAMYLHATKLGNLERKWNLDLYNHLVKELRLMRPIFEKHGLQLMDCSKNSRLSDTYPHITLEKAVEICKAGFPSEPVDPATLPHCSKFAPMHIKKAIAGWPGHKVVEPLKSPEGRSNDEDLQLVI